jgi:hypothetical protein
LEPMMIPTNGCALDTLAAAIRFFGVKKGQAEMFATYFIDRRQLNLWVVRAQSIARRCRIEA